MRLHERREAHVASKDEVLGREMLALGLCIQREGDAEAEARWDDSVARMLESSSDVADVQGYAESLLACERSFSSLVARSAPWVASAASARRW